MLLLLCFDFRKISAYIRPDIQVDDDVFINPEKILATLQTTKLHSAKLYGSDHYIRYALIGKKMVNIRTIRDDSKHTS